MSTQTIFADTAIPHRKSELGHRALLGFGYILAAALILAVLFYGFDYYRLDLEHRPLSPKHLALKPSGTVGLKLGILGLSMFAVIYLYPIRKRWAWLQRQGNSKHWLDFHVLLGLAAPFVIALHAAFKFHGIAGMAYWLMMAVSLSGVAGRYLYGQIPRRVNSAELSLKESRDLQAELVQRLSAQKLIREADLTPLFRMPTAQEVAQLPLLACIGRMMLLDLARPFRIAGLRWRQVSVLQGMASLGGLFATSHKDLEAIIDLAREQARLSKRILFFSRAQQVFHLWHVVHKPFSYSFGVLAVLHIAVVWVLGYI